MKILVEWLKHSGSLHHAYLIEGEREVIEEKILAFVENYLKHPAQGNPDFWHERFETLSIDDARKLKELQLTRPMAHPRKVFVLSIRGMTVEAQNALLKIFEEPSTATHFFVIIPSADVLLPTLRSRMVTISDDARSEKGKKIAQKFIGSSMSERLAMVAPIIEEKDKAAAMELIDSLIMELGGKKTNRSSSMLHELFTLRSYLNDRSPSLKLVLEHVAFVLTPPSP